MVVRQSEFERGNCNRRHKPPEIAESAVGQARLNADRAQRSRSALMSSRGMPKSRLSGLRQKRAMPCLCRQAFTLYP